MQYTTLLLSTIAVLPAAHGIAFGGPAPTGASRALEGWTPKPTKGPSVAELRKRQSAFEYETCGWVNGDLSSAITCFTGTCQLYTASDAVGMAGCCEGSDTQGCAWVNSCVDSVEFAAQSCTGDCAVNSFVRKCTDVEAPYCMSWTYAQDNVKDYVCGPYSDSTWETIYQDATDTFSSLTSSIQLTTLEGNAVTGWEGSSTFTDESTATDETLTEETSTETSTETDSPEETSSPSFTGSRKKSKAKKLPISIIIGAVVGALVLLFLIGAVIIFLCIKKKKAKQIATSQAAMATASASRPQSQYHNPHQPQQMQGQPMSQAPPMPPPATMMSPQMQPGANGHGGYFAPTDPQKSTYQYNATPMTPVSNPPTPAPPYIQPYYANGNTAPPMPTQSPGPAAYQVRQPTPGSHEVDATSAPHAPPVQGQAQGGPVYEMGGGK
ncbi:hypothetical protein P154DRAFT_1144 [Amniculicola lignicola CBS 123094]|uniref:Mid2 domain-containing protein n=1 Tax=Amniculicola lignicola CBS 123094 TaxID=1392246 RepID=A0A6A5X4C5_9PLEO|nr:hypothetical protein P154DRAFT_1144 [Amniculicola lignicola CBS 123094]